MHDKKCFFECTRFFECEDGKPTPETKCTLFVPNGRKIEEPPKAQKINFSKMLGIPVEIED